MRGPALAWVRNRWIAALRLLMWMWMWMLSALQLPRHFADVHWPSQSSQLSYLVFLSNQNVVPYDPHCWIHWRHSTYLQQMSFVLPYRSIVRHAGPGRVARVGQKARR